MTTNRSVTAGARGGVPLPEAAEWGALPPVHPKKKQRTPDGVARSLPEATKQVLLAAVRPLP